MVRGATHVTRADGALADLGARYCIAASVAPMSCPAGGRASALPGSQDGSNDMRLFTTAVVGAALIGSVAAAKPQLRDVKEIDSKMLEIGIALEITKQCERISARKLKGLAVLWQLKMRANTLGYSDDEINAYRKSEAEKARLRALGQDYVKSKGLNPQSAADLCRLGDAEIAKGSVIGRLLKAK